jgi:hypothetical protein
MIETKLISGFPGVGKSYLFNNTDLKVLDSDSSTFDKNEFPSNYIKHIKYNIGKVDIILISSHKEVRDALVDNNLLFTLIYPKIELKKEYLKRYRKRGSNEGFINFISNNWENFILDLDNQKNCNKIKLNKGKYLKGII